VKKYVSKEVTLSYSGIVSTDATWLYFSTLGIMSMLMIMEDDPPIPGTIIYHTCKARSMPAS